MTALPKLATLATIGCALALSACVVEHVPAQPAPPQPPPPPPAVETPSVPAVQLPPGVVNGKPGHYKDGGPQAYWIWRDEVGHYHVRVTAPAGAKTESFRGRAAATVGQLANLHVVHPEHRANINANPVGMVFDFFPKGQNDGFDFDVSDPKACVRFDLNTWSNHHKIVIGTTEQAPTSEHFIVCP